MNLALMRDHSYRFMTDNDVKRDLNDIELLLVPIVGISSYIPVQPNEYLSMSHGYISYKLSDVYIETETNYYGEMRYKTRTIEIHSLSELYTVMHSINRVDFINMIQMEQDQLYGFMFDIAMIEVTLFDEKNQLIYYKKAKGKLIKSDGVITSYRYEDLYGEFSELTYYIDMSVPFSELEDIIILDVEDKIWSTKRSSTVGLKVKELDFYHHEIRGYRSNLTSTYAFIDRERYDLYTKIENLSLYLKPIDIDDRDSVCYPYYVFWGEDIIIFVCFVHFIVDALLRLMTNQHDYLSKDKERSIIPIKLDIEIDTLNGKPVVISYNHNPYTDEVYQDIIKTIGGITC